MMAFMVITRDIVGQEKLAFALGLAYCILCIPKTLGPSLAGLLFDLTRSYVLPFMITGGLVAFSSILMFLINIKKPPKLQTVDEPLCKETIVCKETAV